MTVFGLFASSGILENIKHDVSETGYVFVHKQRVEKTSTQLAPLERANLNHWTIDLLTLHILQTPF
jgi:hypothetical protein